MSMNIKELPTTLGNHIPPSLFIFHSEQDVKEFWSMFSIEPESLSEYGISCLFDEETEEYVCEHLEEALTLPVLDPNPYMGYAHESAHLTQSVFKYKPENLIVDREFYNNFPFIIYLHVEAGFDRIGEVEFKMVVGSPLEDLMDAYFLKGVSQKYSGQWTDKLEEVLEFEAMRNNYFKGSI